MMESQQLKAIPRIAILRQQENISQKELAEYLNVTVNTIANWERGRSGIEWIETVIKLCKIFVCSPEELIEYMENRHS